MTLNLDSGEITCDTVADMKTGDTVVLPIPTKTGYVFEGWSIGEVDLVINHYTFTMGSMDTTLTASWTANVQTFLYNGTNGSDGSVQIFTAPQTGTYEVEAWGAQGGSYNSTYYGGYGAYTSGEIYLEKEEKLYIYVGGQSQGITGGYNGGGTAFNSSGKGGGGAYYNSGWQGVGGAGGGLTGYAGVGYGRATSGGTQTLGGGYVEYGQNGSFGMGGTNNNDGSNVSIECGAGAGSGYYGGGCSAGASPAGGRSSYISGHAGCLAINDLSQETSPRTILSGCTSTSSNIECSYHPVLTNRIISVSINKYFTDTLMIDGAGYGWTTVKDSTTTQMPNPNGGNYNSGGNIGNGFARITFIE